MSIQHKDGHYDEKGHWVRDKLCFVSCGDRCTCSPPNRQYILPGSEAEKEIIAMVELDAETKTN